MAHIKLRDGTVIGDYEKSYIVAEMNTSHFGDIEAAKRMIEKAKEAGCSCMKFQSWSEQSLYSKTAYDENPILKKIVSSFSFSETELLELSEYCKKLGVAFASTPYSKQEVDFLLNACDAPFIKVASMDVSNYPFLAYIAATGAPIILSTGMSDLEEIKKAVSVIEGAGNLNVAILHCVSLYPMMASQANLNNILGLRREFPRYPIGFSDHSLGVELPVAATALGACLIEKHFTLDKSKIGMDNQMATEPEEMAELVRYCEHVQAALGSEERVIPEELIEQGKKMRRSIIAARDIKKGERIQIEDLDAKRPGTGLPPENMQGLVGKTATRDIEADTLIRETDVK
jgi:N-acetylneuraminate synthase